MMTLRAEMKQAFCSVEDVELDERSLLDRSTRLPRASTPAPHTHPNLRTRHQQMNARPETEWQSTPHHETRLPSNLSGAS